MNHQHIHWLGHASFRIEDGATQIYIDPWKLPAHAPKADVILSPMRILITSQQKILPRSARKERRSSPQKTSPTRSKERSLRFHRAKSTTLGNSR